jgi:hypothetical protein
LSFNTGRTSLLAVIALSTTMALANEPAPAPASESTPLTPGISTDEFGSPELDFQGDQPTLVAPGSNAYQLYIADMESRQGPYANGLSEQLLGLGTIYQNQGLHSEAINSFKRGIHVSRVNNGLYGAEQIPLLQGLIRSLVANGEFELADERQQYLYRVQSTVYQGNAPQMTSAMLQRAAWERQAYYLALGETSFTRLLTMWELYGNALSSIAQREGNYSQTLLSPLMGLLQTQYLISSYDGEAQPTYTAGSAADLHFVEESQFAGIRGANYRQGQAVLGALREVYDYNEGEQSEQSAEALVRLGDWHQWHNKRESALQVYQQAWDQLAQREDGESLLQQYFGTPVLLPDLPGINNSIIPPAEISGQVEISYIIDTRGQVVELEITKLEPVDEADQREPLRLLRKIKRGQYRPILVERELAATETIVKRYAY